MAEDAKKITTIDDYIAQYDGETKKRLLELRKTIRAEAPKAEEKISWAMPTYALHGNIVHFAAAKSHIGLYPGASGVEHFLPELEGYHTSKGAIQLPNAKPLPLELVKKIVRFRLEENIREYEKKTEEKKRGKQK